MTREQAKDAMTSGQLVQHTHMGIPIKYRISGVITRYNKRKGWTYSLELQDLKSSCIVIASMEDCEVVL
ncbi:MAG: hypothetical protein J1F04_01670 [Oscillospiraceae bacterium]|nr:hypothetical protein [Oscillospiraceae bacterium]